MEFLASTTTSIDTGIITQIIGLAKSCMGLFTEFPINIFLYAGLTGIGFTIFKRAKRSAS